MKGINSEQVDTDEKGLTTEPGAIITGTVQAQAEESEKVNPVSFELIAETFDPKEEGEVFTLEELRGNCIDAQAVGDAGVLGHFIDMNAKKLARTLKKKITGFVYDTINNLTVGDFFETLDKTKEYIQEHQTASLDEANGNPQKQQLIFAHLTGKDPRISESHKTQSFIWKQKVKFKVDPIRMDVEDFEKIQKFIFRDVKEYVFDISLLFPTKPVVVEFSGHTKEVSPYTAFKNLELNGFMVFNSPPEADKVLKNNIRQL